MTLALIFCAPFVAIGVTAIAGRAYFDRLDRIAFVRDEGRA